MARKKSPAMEELHRLAWEKAKEDHPGIPEHALPAPSFSQKDANAVTKSIIAYIKLRGGFATRQQSQGQARIERLETVVGTMQKLRFTRSTVEKGVADISAIIPPGRSLQVEVKFGKDRLSSEQKAMRAKVEAAGGIYYVAKDFDSFHSWFNEIFKQQ